MSVSTLKHSSELTSDRNIRQIKHIATSGVSL